MLWICHINEVKHQHTWWKRSSRESENHADQHTTWSPVCPPFSPFSMLSSGLLFWNTKLIMFKNIQWHVNVMMNIKLLSAAYEAHCNVSSVCLDHLLIPQALDVPTTFPGFPSMRGPVPELCSPRAICLECSSPAPPPGEFWLVFQQCHIFLTFSILYYIICLYSSVFLYIWNSFKGWTEIDLTLYTVLENW